MYETLDDTDRGQDKNYSVSPLSIEGTVSTVSIVSLSTRHYDTTTLRHDVVRLYVVRLYAAAANEAQVRQDRCWDRTFVQADRAATNPRGCYRYYVDSEGIGGKGGIERAFACSSA